MMVTIKMAPTDTTTLHTVYSHADHIMTDKADYLSGSPCKAHPNCL